MRFIPSANTIPVVYKKSFANKNVSILAGIVAYNPDGNRLLECVNSIINQVENVLIIDNGSVNKNTYFKLLKDKIDNFNKITFIEYNHNKGIAKALFDIMQYAIDKKYDWVLTLDDDSVANLELISNYKKFTNMPKLATMTCVMEDRNYNRNEQIPKLYFEYVYRCITSGCLMNVEAYKNTLGYDVDLFIDRVDDDICYKLTRAGYKHIKVNYVGLLHEMGNGQEKQFLWHTARADNYNKIRHYYIFRNEYIIRKKYPELIRIEWLQSGRPMIVNFICASLKVLLYEDDKAAKIKAMLAGWKDGKKYIKNMNN